MQLGTKGPDRWAIILAGGEGTRLRPLTRRIAGGERPKQFCPLVDGDTLLDRTRRRAALSVSAERTRLVLTHHHAPFYAALLADVPPGSLVVQPWGRGTAPAILYGLLRVAEGRASGAVVLFPSDHYVSDDARFMAHVEAAFATVEARPDLVVLLGIVVGVSTAMARGVDGAALAVPIRAAVALLSLARRAAAPARVK